MNNDIEFYIIRKEHQTREYVAVIDLENGGFVYYHFEIDRKALPKINYTIKPLNDIVKLCGAPNLYVHRIDPLKNSGRTLYDSLLNSLNNYAKEQFAQMERAEQLARLTNPETPPKQK